MLVLLKPRLHKFHTLKKLLVPNYFQILSSNLLSTPHSKQQLQKLEELDKKKHLYRYFSSRQKQWYTVEQIYYYLQKKKQANIQFLIPSRKLLTNLELKCFDLFVIARQERMLKSLDVQKKLIIEFNERCMDLSVKQFQMCLEMIKEFSIWVVKTNLQIPKARSKVLAIEKDNKNLQILSILHILKENSLLMQIFNEKECKQITEKIGKQIMNQKCNTKNLCILQQLQGQFNIIVNKQEREKKIRIAIQNEKLATKQEMYYALKTVDKYPQYLKELKYQNLEPKFYIKYLQIMKRQQKKNEQIPTEVLDSDLPPVIAMSSHVDHHHIPLKVLKETIFQQFSTIIKSRVEIGLQNRQELSKIMKETIKINKNILLGLVKYLNENNIEDPKTWMDLQKFIFKELGLNHKKWTAEDILANYYVQDLFSILSYMAINNNGSVKFWKTFNLFVFDVLMLRKITFKKKDTNYNDFIINIYEIYQNRTIPQPLFDKVTNMGLVALANNSWTERELLKLAKTLALSKIDTHEVWYAIENKLMSLNINYRKREDEVIIFANILKYFEQMNVGTYEFKKTILKILNANKFDYEGFLKTKRSPPFGSPISNEVSIKKMDIEISELEN